ncbi:hypothetical protein TSOC_003845 [Tetrabaena socialis]|uniref:FAS1 domain-containing protein n=1 Tax=Tetrabaena socialis TaxID=47790 RepID=A0A2J8AAG8_9CHLO|nr:hypothetical protein TSOC_003845 [Tetrabaena socialis]|eukprot:PNH09512.1 hypothetical protein TSOC_003845 [Tetrabaena socialis]
MPQALNATPPLRLCAGVPVQATDPQQPAGAPSAANAAANASAAALRPPLGGLLDESIPCDGTSLLSAVTMQSHLATLRAAVRAAGLSSRLNTLPAGANVTLFAPTDEAFTAFATDWDFATPQLLLSSDPERLRRLLLYHLSPRALPPAELAVTPALDTFWAGQQVLVPQPFQAPSALAPAQGAVAGESGTEARISRRIRVCGSYIYLLSYVLLPGSSLYSLPPFAEYNPQQQQGKGKKAPDPPCAANSTVLDVLRANASLSMTLRHVEASGLGPVLSNLSYTPGYTLFAPTDAAWKAVAGQLQTGSSKELDSATLRAVLAAHVLPYNRPAAALHSQLYGTLGGAAAGPLFVAVSPDGVRLQTPAGADARVVAPDVGAARRPCGSSVHVVDGVLWPQTLPAAGLTPKSQPQKRM